MPIRVAKFEKVSYEQFEKDFMDTFELDADTIRTIENIYDKISIPKRSTKFSAGYDFTSPISFTLTHGETIKIPTGIRVGMNTDWVLLLFPRSSLGFKYQMGMCNTIPVVDSDYFFSDNEGHIFVKLVNNGNDPVHIKLGDKFVQGVFLPYGITENDQVETDRNGGMGSTGR